eukprot:6178142-Pleurochrysis_carterae.AAC.1
MRRHRRHEEGAGALEELVALLRVHLVGKGLAVAHLDVGGVARQVLVRVGARRLINNVSRHTCRHFSCLRCGCEKPPNLDFSFIAWWNLRKLFFQISTSMCAAAGTLRSVTSPAISWILTRQQPCLPARTIQKGRAQACMKRARN